MQKSRHHPLTIILDIWGFIRGSIFIIFFLFIINFTSENLIWKYGRYAYIIVAIFSLIYLIWKWISKKYELTETAFHLYKGIFNKEEQVVPFDRIQNVNRKTTIVHRVFGMTSLYFETAMSGENATVTFPALTKQRATSIEEFVEEALEKKTGESKNTSLLVSEEILETNNEQSVSRSRKKRTIHFIPTAKDTVRTTFTSFSFLILIPIVVSGYFKISELFHIEERTKGITNYILETWWITVLVIAIGVIISMGIGTIRIYLKYGKYEITSDEERVYIKQGVINETSFSIAKKNIQAIEIQQSLIKRILGIVEVKLISAGQLNLNEDDLEISSLYPFLKKEWAMEILQEMLPSYEIKENMKGLTRPALWLRIVKSNFYYAIPATIILFIKPNILGITAFWWYVIVFGIWILLNLTIVLNYFHSALSMNHAFIQFRSGTFGTSFFLTKRDKIMEVIITRSFLQRKFGLATLKTVNRAQPVHHTEMSDVSLEVAHKFYHWYKQRTKEIKLDNDSNVPQEL